MGLKVLRDVKALKVFKASKAFLSKASKVFLVAADLLLGFARRQHTLQ
jgi:hypothetical protein